MIFKFMADFTYNMVNVFMGVMPIIKIDDRLIQGISEVMNTISTLNWLLPIDAVVISLSAIIVFHSSTLVWYMINWLIRKIPTVD